MTMFITFEAYWKYLALFKKVKRLNYAKTLFKIVKLLA